MASIQGEHSYSSTLEQLERLPSPMNNDPEADLWFNTNSNTIKESMTRPLLDDQLTSSPEMRPKQDNHQGFDSPPMVKLERMNASTSGYEFYKK
jgi:hypothetical protein